MTEFIEGVFLPVVMAAFCLGCWAGWAWSQRRIDHRWYCGHFHPASNPCKPTKEHLESHRKFEADQERADELEIEARRLRRGL